MSTRSETRRAVVTGASSGIGAAFAARLARDGYDIVAIGRRADRLDALAARIRARSNRNVEVVIADLSRDEDLRHLEKQVTQDESLEVLVNNAGFSPLVPFTEQTLEDIEAMVRVHVLAVTRLTRAALPGMMARRRGDIINVSSDGVFVTVPGPVMAVYAATKSYVNAFTQSIQGMGQNTGIRAQALCAGFVRTEILARHGIAFEDWGIPDSATMEPDVLVEASLAALELGEVICVPTLDDPALLSRIEEIKEIVRERSSSSGTPAGRYVRAAGNRSDT
jgi:short-subunit dehydrogenase